MRREAFARSLITQQRRSLLTWSVRRRNNQNLCCQVTMAKSHCHQHKLTRCQRCQGEAGYLWEAQESGWTQRHLTVSQRRIIMLRQSLSILMRDRQMNQMQMAISSQIKLALHVVWLYQKMKLQLISVLSINHSKTPMLKSIWLNSLLVLSAISSKNLNILIVLVIWWNQETWVIITSLFFSACSSWATSALKWP